MAAPSGVARGMPASAVMARGAETVAGLAVGPARSSADPPAWRGGAGSEGAGLLVALFVSSTSSAGRSVMDEPGPDGGRRTVSGGPLDGKPFAVTGYEVWCAWEQVRDNKGAPGVDGQSIAAFEERLEDNLYKVWNRMSAGSYMPPPVRAVEIPKAGGGTRTLGVPTIADRVAQAVAANRIGTVTEMFFHADSYGYRPGRGAHDALAVARKRCWDYDWVIESGIRKFFDSVPHDLVVRAVEELRLPAWVLLYVTRWLAAPVVMPDGEARPRDRGTPQGALCSASHKPPYEQRRVMRSAGLLALVTALPGAESCA
jgi:hypothetical protein